MDFFSEINDVKNLNGYITVTQELANRSNTNLKFTLNTATVLALKKIRSIEIEYFNKRDENGIACIIFEYILSTPPSKVWGLLAKELIHLLQYWLEAIRKHLINHSTHWWMFLKLLLKFIKEMYLKDPTIPDLLVEFTAECLFDLATGAKPDVFQRHEILHSLNMVCAASSREVRFALRVKFGDCFVKLASSMATSGYLPHQYSSLECLLRWLLPRQDRALRAAALDKWFPRDLCPDAARACFLNSTWMNFCQDAREFLNAVNEGNGLVTSVVCRQLTIGQIVVINGAERQASWLDFNTSARCVSVLLEPRQLEAFGVAGHRACEALSVHCDGADTALLRRESLGLTMALQLQRPLCIKPSDIACGDGRRVTAVVSSRADPRALDQAMRITFGDKYQLQFDLDSEISQSPQITSSRSKAGNYSEEDTRFSHPVEVKKHKHSGYIVRPRYVDGLASPSTASTSSIIHLKDRLAALPRFPRFDKEPVSVVAEPSLSKVSECPEHDECSVKTARFQSYAAFPKPTPEPKSRSDGETVRSKNRGGRRFLSPVVSDDNSTSLNLVATVGYDESIINETIERLSKSKEYAGDNIVDLLVQEALQAKPSVDVSDSGINTDEKKSQELSEAIDDTPNEIKAKNRVLCRKSCVISTTDDESNTEAINETPASLKKSIRCRKKSTPKIEEKQTFDVKTVEEFFSQHVAETQRGEIVISPSLAKKINETSSETSNDFDENYFMLNEEVHTDIEQNIFNDIAIIECVNEMVDQICKDFDDYTDNLYRENVTNINKSIEHKGKADSPKNINAKPKPASKVKNIKLKYKPVKKAKPRANKKSKAVEQKSEKKMSTIIELREEEINQATEDNIVVVVNVKSPQKAETPKNKNKETPPLKRKRKLYSPKEDDFELIEHVNISSDDVPLSKIKEPVFPKTQTTPMCYKEIEKERKKYTRLPRTRKSKVKGTEMPSPRTVLMNTVFDNLKDKIENNENIKKANISDNVYNFTSDSEDEDFKKKKIEIKKRTTGSDSKAKGKNTRRGKESDTSYEDIKKTKPVQRKKVTKRTKQKTGDKEKLADLVKIDLIDERMREAVKEKLNTSLVVDPPANPEPVELEPILHGAPQMEQIQDCEPTHKSRSKKLQKVVSKVKAGQRNDSDSNDTSTRKNAKTQIEKQDSASNDTLISRKTVNKRSKKTTAVTIKKEKGVTKKNKTISVPDNDDRTSSPMPGLLVEASKPKYKDDNNESLNTNMLQKFKKIYRDGPDVNDSVLTQNMLSDLENINVGANKTIPKKNNKNMTKKKTDEVIDIQDITARNYSESEKSMATDGITGHGDDEEAPPATETIEETFQPRELQDLDQSMKDYFTKLTRQIHDSSKASIESSKSPNDGVLRSGVNTSALSPVVSVKRLSYEDISRWIPSRRTSDTTSPQTSSKNKSAKKISETPSTTKSSVKNTPRFKMKTAKVSTPVKTKSAKLSTADSVKLKSPIKVAIARISLEEFNKWLPPMPVKTLKVESNRSPQKPTRQLRLRYPIRSKSKSINKQIITEKDKPSTKTNEAAKSRSATDDSDNNDSNNVSSKITRLRHTKEVSRKRQLNDSDTDETRLKEPKNKKLNKHDVKSIPTKSAANKSIISPVQLDFTATKFEDENSKDSSDDEYVSKKEINTARNKPKTNVFKVGTPKSRKSVSIEDTPGKRKRKCKSPVFCVSKKKNTDPQTSFNRSKSSDKLKFTVEPKRLFEAKKKIDVLEDLTFTGSGPSTSTVNDWIKRTVPAIIDPSMSLRDTVQNVMEKLDTTLVEINQNTSTKFVNLFVEAQKELDVLSQQIDKSQSMVESFKEKFKAQAVELIRADCQQRRAMVVLLKEDVQAVLHHMDGEKD